MKTDQIIEQASDISIDDVPDMKGAKYPERMMISLSTQTYLKLKKLKASNKDHMEFIRILIDRALEKLPV